MSKFPWTCQYNWGIHLKCGNFYLLVDLSFVDEGADSLYFCGNSLGIQPKEAGVVVKEEMEKWQKMYVVTLCNN